MIYYRDMAEKTKRLTKSNNKMLSGVCAGIAEFINLDPTVVRLVWVLLTAMTGFVPGILAYVIAAVIMPEKIAS